MKDDLLLEDTSFELMPEFGAIRGRGPMKVAGIPPTGRNKVPPADRIKAANLASFDFDRSELKSHHRQDIERVAAQIAESWRVGSPFFTVYAVGHTDSEGAYQHNMALGLRRALAVRRKLTEALRRQGGNLAYKVLILAQSKGPSELIDRSRTPEGQAQNRRAEIFLSTKALKSFRPKGRVITLPEQIIYGQVPRGGKLVCDKPLCERLGQACVDNTVSCLKDCAVNMAADTAACALNPAMFAPCMAVSGARRLWCLKKCDEARRACWQTALQNSKCKTC